MFTINIYLKLGLIALCIIGGTILAIFVGFWFAFPVIFIGLLLLVSYLMLGTVQSAAQMMQTMDFQGARNRLRLTANPKLLYKPNRAFYHMLLGTIAMQEKDNTQAEIQLERAKEIGMPGDNEMAMLYLQLANLSATKNNWTAARNHFKDAKALKISEEQLKEQMQQFEKVLKNRGSMKAAQHRHRGQMANPGGKRRRPRSR